MSFSEEAPREIVIIKRGGHSAEEAHHGGMWKIAYADFMTAMMALFLVLWLVNSADEQTLAQVSTYFNPIDLSDNTTTERGLQDKNQAGSGEAGENEKRRTGNTKDDEISRNDLDRTGVSDVALFSDPYDVLAKIAAKAVKVQSGQGGQQQGTQINQAGEAFRDPFDPDFRYNSNRDVSNPLDLNPQYDAASKGQAGETGEKAAAGAAQSDPKAMPFADKLAEQADAAAEIALKAEKAEEAAKTAKDKADAKAMKALSAEQAQIQQELFDNIRKSGLTKLPDVSVEQTSEGILISLTDQSDFEMFALSSAEPKPELVILMEQLAGTLAKQPGELVIRGHTDSRPFRSKTYDNWRLSTARAHIAHYMLMRGGLPKERFERIEGYADRNLKVADDPNAAQNRRIEILLKPEKT